MKRNNLFKINVVIAFVLLFLNGCTTEKKDLEQLCEDLDGSYECAQKIEQHQLLVYNDIVSRTDNKLILKRENNIDIVLQDVEKDVEGVHYLFRDYLEEINSYLIFIQYYEGGDYCLINKHSGQKIIIPGLVKISPDKNRFVSYNQDIEAMFSTNGFVIYKLLDNSFVKEYEVELSDWGPSNAEWLDDNNIEFEKYSWDGKSYGIHGKVIYEYDNTWKIKPKVQVQLFTS